MTTESPRVILHNNEPDAMMARFAERFPDADVRACRTYEDLPPLISAFRPDVFYGIRFAGTDQFPHQALKANDGPKWVSIGGSGVDHMGGWDPDKLQVTNSAGVAAGMMAEYMIGGFLHFMLDVPGLQKDQARRHWQSDRQVMPLQGKTLLIVGLGSTGQALAARAKAFGMHVIGTRARPQETPHVDAVHGVDELPQLWGRADFISVCVPLLPSTKGMVDAAAFAAMKPGAVLADVSRGGVIETSALLAALNTGRLAGAVLDVFEEEPLPADHAIWSAPNTLISPHCSSVYEGWEMASFDMFLDNLENWIAGRPLNNLVSPALGY